MDLKYVSSLLFVRDVGASRRFYENLLGQKVGLDHGECVAFSAGFAIMLRGYAQEVIFQGRYTGPSPDRELGVELYFETGDIAGARDVMSGHGVRFVHDILEQPWGQRVFRVYDPDSNIVEVGEPMEVVIKRFLSEGMPVGDVAARTSMPLEIIRQMAMNG